MLDVRPTDNQGSPSNPAAALFGNAGTLPAQVLAISKRIAAISEVQPVLTYMPDPAEVTGVATPSPEVRPTILYAKKQQLQIAITGLSRNSYSSSGQNAPIR